MDNKKSQNLLTTNTIEVTNTNNIFITNYVTNTVYMPPATVVPQNAGQNNSASGQMFVAIEEGDLDKVSFYLSLGANVNARSPVNYYSGATALMSAVGSRRMEIVKLLLDSGADVNLTASQNKVQGITALMIAAQQGPVDFVKILIEAGAQINASTSGAGAGNTALMAAARANKPAIVYYLYTQKAEINKQNSLGQTALMIAAQNNCFDVVNLMLKMEGINHTIPDKAGIKALDYAYQNSHEAIVSLILQYETTLKNY